MLMPGPQPLLIVVFVSAVQQFSGVSVIRAYSVAIFDSLFSSNSSRPLFSSNSTVVVAQAGQPCSHTSSLAYIAAIVIGVCRLVAALTLTRLLRSVPRRAIYFTSLGLTILCLVVFASLSWALTAPLQSQRSTLQWAALLAACLLVLSVQLGVQTLPLILSGEIFPADVRATCKGLTRAVTCVFLLLSLKLYPQLETYLALHGTFFLFGTVLIILLPACYLVLPETKDVSLEDIQQYFAASES